MRVFSLYALVALSILFLSLGCAKEEKRTDSPKPTAQSPKPSEQVINYTMNNDIPTLAQIDADPSTDLIAVPNGYQLGKQGIWSYNTAYLLVNPSTQSVLAEVYQFDNTNIHSADACDRKYLSSGTGSVSCPPNGSACEMQVNSNPYEVCFVRCS